MKSQLILLLILFRGILHSQVCPSLTNKSLEGLVGNGAPPGWSVCSNGNVCGNGQIMGVNGAANITDGSYAGYLIAGETSLLNATASIGQATTLTSGVTYTLTIDAMKNAIGLNGELKIFGSTTPCGCGTQLGTTVAVSNTSYNTKTFTFTPAANYTHIRIEASCPTCGLSDNSYIFIDKICGGDIGGLPIELQDYQINCLNGTIEVSWITATETNNDFFTLERTTDKINHTHIGSIQGAGNSATPQYYKINDDGGAIPNKIIYYRLKQTDYDGKFKYYDLGYINKCNSEGEDFNNIKLYPNPSKNQLFFQFNCTEDKELQIEIINILGQVIYTREENATKGENLLLIDNSQFDSGVYFFRISDGKKSFNEMYMKE